MLAPRRAALAAAGPRLARASRCAAIRAERRDAMRVRVCVRASSVSPDDLCGMSSRYMADTVSHATPSGCKRNHWVLTVKHAAVNRAVVARRLREKCHYCSRMLSSTQLSAPHIPPPRFATPSCSAGFLLRLAVNSQPRQLARPSF